MCKPSDASASVSAAEAAKQCQDVPPNETNANQALAQDNLRKGTLYGSLSLALVIAGFSLTMPHLQSRRDALECDSLCYGSTTSARSALSLIGGFAISRLSDSDTSLLARTVGRGSGRKACLYIGTIASVVGLIIGGMTFSIRGMWLSMIPGALFQQNFNVLKSLLADLHHASEESKSTSSAATSGTAAARAASVGKLGMSLGLSFMFGPLMGATLIKSFDQAVLFAIVLTVLSMLMVARLPHATKSDSVSTSRPSENSAKVESSKSGILSFLDVKAARTPSALFLMSVRVCMALAFHIFMTIWTVSLKERFDFGPSDHGKFMSFIGLTYALSQGVVAKRIVKPLGNKGRIRVIQLCCLALGIGRYFAFHTSSLTAVYVLFSFIITALGVLNTILTGDTATLASPEEVGGLHGVLESVESVAGMVGPVAGGALALIDPIGAPLVAVVGLYFAVLLLVSFGYEKLILTRHAASVKKDV